MNAENIQSVNHCFFALRNKAVGVRTKHSPRSWGFDRIRK